MYNVLWWYSRHLSPTQITVIIVMIQCFRSCWCWKMFATSSELDAVMNGNFPLGIIGQNQQPDSRAAHASQIVKLLFVDSKSHLGNASSIPHFFLISTWLKCWVSFLDLSWCHQWCSPIIIIILTIMIIIITFINIMISLTIYQYQLKLRTFSNFFGRLLFLGFKPILTQNRLFFTSKFLSSLNLC